ncbi:MAG: FAD-binding oxidoreductase [Gammaproteobacteria bacterium SHHR-1]|uniref:FAD-binding oxidoreductase n=1 Tax=Magnetovirga frankeli TaxID=947516 RepID=UPI001293FEBD|nr:oxidoreductase [gamma proteobacterium SS-5]
MNLDASKDAWNIACEASLLGSKRISPEDTDEVRVIDLRISDSAFRYQEGQTIGVLIDANSEFGNYQHHRYYSIANARDQATDEDVDIQIIVRRCFYIDEVSGEQYPGVASNYLCDAKPGDKITLTGPYKNVFKMPKDRSSNLLMLGTGTGIAPFRAFVQRIYADQNGWDGQVRLFYGDRNGLDLRYLNQVDQDLANYYVEDSFKAFQAVTQNYVADETQALEHTLKDNLEEAWDLLSQPNTHVFLAGTHKANKALQKTLAERAGSKEDWERLKQKMQDEGRWSELLYN